MTRTGMSTVDQPVSEDQTTEWKSSWHDDYLKWVCGFANAQGGVRRAANSPEPQIRVEPRDVLVEFPFSASYVTSVSGAVERTAPVETPVETPVKTPVKTRVEILRLLAARPDMTLAEVAATIGKSRSAVERASARLAKEGRLRYVGPRKGGHWVVIGETDA